MINSSWFIVMTKPRMEIQTETNLKRQGFDVFFPIWVELRRRCNTWQKVQSAMFPRYLFVRPSSIEQSISPVKSTRGVSRLVFFGAQPAKASDKLINELRQLGVKLKAASDGLNPFKTGDEVVVSSGPFKGVSAKVLASDQERVILLFQFLGKLQRVELEAGICQIR